MADCFGSNNRWILSRMEAKERLNIGMNTRDVFVSEWYTLLDATYKDGVMDVYELHEATQLLNIKILCDEQRKKINIEDQAYWN